MSEDDARTIVKDLAEAISTQARAANQMWLAVITVAVVGAIPRKAQEEGIPLPFSFGTVDEPTFYTAMFAMLCVLIVAFCAAHAQQIRTIDLAQSHLKELPRVGNIHPRELLDMMRLPSVNRIASLAQALRGRYQFSDKEHLCPGWLRLVSTNYYVVLKLAATAVYFGLPFWALFVLFFKLKPLLGCFSGSIAVGGLLIASAALLQTTIIELRYLVTVADFLMRRGEAKG